MGKKVICYIQAYDCERTVEAAMRSVLEQTYDNWLCVVVSNGNKNTIQKPNWTYEVIKKFAAKDRRFIVLNRRKNCLRVYTWMMYHLGKCFPDSYICTLDADDEYENDFFERAVSFAEEYDLDIAACGTEILLKERAGAPEKALLGRRQVAENTVIREKDYTDQFVVYKPFFNELWGKLYRAELLVNTERSKAIYSKPEKLFISDTIFAMNLLSHSSAIGILSGTSHKFFQFEVRAASNGTFLLSKDLLRDNRGKFGLLPVYRTYKVFMSFLDSHGKVSDELYEYMQAVLFGWLNDFYTRVLLQVQDEKTLVNLISRMAQCEKFDELMFYRDGGKYDNLRNYGKREEFCKLLYYTLICQKGIRSRSVLGPGNFFCCFATERKIDRVAAKLKATVRELSELQERRE